MITTEVVLMGMGILMIIGEMKVVWLNQHNLTLGKMMKDRSWRQLLGM